MNWKFKFIGGQITDGIREWHVLMTMSGPRHWQGSPHRPAPRLLAGHCGPASPGAVGCAGVPVRRPNGLDGAGWPVRVAGF